MRTLLLSLLLLLAAEFSGCATWQTIGGRYVDKSLGYEVEYPVGWIGHFSSESSVITKDGVFLQFIAISRLQIGEPLQHTKRKFEAKMMPEEVANVAIADLRSNANLSNLKILENNPAVLSGKPACKLLYSFKTKAGEAKKGSTYALISGQFAYQLLYEANSRYFDRELGVFEKVVDSFRVLALD